MGMPAKRSRRWSRSDVLALMAANPLHTPRYEVVHGELLMTPSPGGLHQAAVLELAKALSAYCDATGVGETFISPSDVDLEGGGLLQPDVYVVPLAEGVRLRREGPARTLLLAAEVLSPGSERVDRGAKKELYQATVPLYWLIDARGSQVEQWVHGVEGSSVERETLRWHPVGVEHPFVLELRQFFKKVRAE